jgi:glycosyltransferase involved in cell wall biosynthesis/SAM-dependent methyltransferase/outer membrane murein-binding lipoprotein Lpp
MNACTIIAKNYLAHARVLAESFYEHHPDGTFTTLVVDEVEGYLDPGAERFDLVTAAELGIEDFDLMATAYDVMELSTAVKPWFLRYLLHERKMDSVVYLDPDIRIFDPMDELESLLSEHGLVLIPHATAPMPRDGKKPSESDILIAGVYNLGFLAVKSGPQTDRQLDWWSERLRTDCKVAPERGYFVDQRWIDFIHGIADDFYVLKDPEYNVAYWNLHGRDFTFEDGRYYADGRPLRFFHFSGFDPDRRHMLSKHQTRILLSDNPALTRICDEYADALLEQGYGTVKTWPYTYAMLANGIKLDRVMRGLYLEGREAGLLEEPIFQPAGAESFVAWLNEPAEKGERFGITRYLYALYLSRPDLQRAFAKLDADSNVAQKYAGWVAGRGRIRIPIHERLLPPTPADSKPAPTNTSKQSLGVNVAGYLRSELGVGEAARQVITALDAQKIPLAPIGIATRSSRQEHNFASFSGFDPPFPINLICVNADMLPAFAKEIGPQFFEGRYSIGLWWWEVSQFPDRWTSSFDRLDEVWVGTQHVADALSKVSPIPVIKVTLPVSMPKVAQLDRAALGMPEGFVFLYVFDYNSVFERKNPLRVVEAFKSAFPSGSGASLVVKCVNGERDLANHERLRVAANAHPDIHIIDSYVSVAEKNAIIANCDCYVSLHRSEGFGLTLAEAMQFGKPVVATAYSGNLDYMTNQNSYLIDYRLEPIGENAEPYPASGEWAEPDVAQAAEVMRHIFEHQDEGRERGARGATDIRRSHSPEVAGHTMVKRLEWIMARRRHSNSAVDRRASETVHPKAEAIIKHVEAGPGIPAEGRLGRVGRFLRQTALRLIWPVVSHQQAIDKAILATINRTHESLRESLEVTAKNMESQSATAHAELLSQLRKQGRQIEDLSGEVATLRAKYKDLSGEVATLRAKYKDLSGEVATLRAKNKAANRQNAAANRLVKESHAIPYMARSPFRLSEDPVAGIVMGYARQNRSDEDSNDYMFFEDIFRGPEDFIRDRQRRYLDIVAGHEPILDVGCGRGEFLDILREQGIEYTGVDIDPDMIERCQAKGHERVKLADANSYLEGLADDSLGAIFSAQVIEHLPYDELLRFLELSHRKVRPNGLLITETVNPHSVPAMKTFWVDLSHQHPIFPEVALTLCRSTGFASAFVFHPNGSGDVEVDRFKTGEYAVVARKAAQEPEPAPDRALPGSV